LNPPINLITILGATATGKTRLAVSLARLLDGEIISADSRQVYRGFDIGSGKDLAEFGEIPYHLIDIVDPGYEFNLFEFQTRFCDAFRLIQAKGRLPFLVGGTGLYIDAIVNRYQLKQVGENTRLREELSHSTGDQLMKRLEKQVQVHNTTDLLDRERLIRAIEIAEAEHPIPDPDAIDMPELNSLILGIRFPRPELRKRITERLRYRLDNGLIEEVEQLHKSGVSFEVLDFYGLEYRYLGQFVQGTLSRNDMYQKLNSAIHQFAKRQETWFRRMEKRGATIHWLDGEDNTLEQALAIINKFSAA
jgi:tRNA dimethylallyltransferase